MDVFNEQVFVAKEWLVKVDAHTSTPYLFKFHFSPVDLTCCIMATDTRRTWAEALSSKQLARRWRECNSLVDPSPFDDEDEEAWRTRTLDLLSGAHTLGGMQQLEFEVVESKFGDIAFRFECSAFRWRWETIFVGYKASADVLSKHLIMPLISVNHLAFSSPDVVADLPPPDLEKAIDKVARTARRTVDTHVKNALSKPRLATTIGRMTAVFNFISDPPRIAIDAEHPALVAPREPAPKMSSSAHEPNVGQAETVERDKSVQDTPPIKAGADSGSATESESDPSIQPVPGGAAGADRADVRMRSPTPPRAPGGARSRSGRPPSETDSSPVRPIKKKTKPRAPSSDADSEEERKKVAVQIRSGASAPGIRQPIKRGGKRF